MDVVDLWLWLVWGVCAVDVGLLIAIVVKELNGTILEEKV